MSIKGSSPRPTICGRKKRRKKKGRPKSLRQKREEKGNQKKWREKKKGKIPSDDEWRWRESGERGRDLADVQKGG